MKWSWGHWLDRVGRHLDELRFRKQRVQAAARLEAALAARTPGQHLLFRVEDLFMIRGRGLVLLPGADGTIPFQAGDQVELRRPDRTTISSTIRGFESARSTNQFRLPVLLGPEVTATDVPLQTEIWLVVPPNHA